MITLLSAGLVAASCTSKEELRTTEVPLKVMSYNIHSGMDRDNRYDIDRIAEVIRDSGAEIIGLQEVDAHWSVRSRFDDEVKLLAQNLGMNSYFAPIYDLPSKQEGGPRRQFGVAVLSRYPILEANNREMTRLSTQVRDASPERAPGLAEVLVDVKGVRVKIYSVHLDYRPEPAVRRLQVKELLDVLSENDYEKIVLGDFNARTTAPELTSLYSVLYDTWAKIRSSEPGFTFPAEKPDRKIDHIFVSRGIVAMSANIIDALASDHRPIAADVMVPFNSGTQ